MTLRDFISLAVALKSIPKTDASGFFDDATPVPSPLKNFSERPSPPPPWPLDAA